MAIHRTERAETVVLHVGGLSWASQTSVADTVLGRRPGVLSVDADPVAQTANVTFDPATTSIAELRRWVTECACECAGQSVPAHLCDPMAEPAAAEPTAAAPDDHAQMHTAGEPAGPRDRGAGHVRVERPGRSERSAAQTAQAAGASQPSQTPASALTIPHAVRLIYP